MFTNPERHGRAALKLHTVLCSRCRARLGRPTGLLSHDRVKVADDYAAEEAQARALADVRRENLERQRELRRKQVMVPLLVANGVLLPAPDKTEADE